MKIVYYTVLPPRQNLATTGSRSNVKCIIGRQLSTVGLLTIFFCRGAKILLYEYHNTLPSVQVSIAKISLVSGGVA
jgi:hypothetical protein